MSSVTPQDNDYCRQSLTPGISPMVLIASLFRPLAHQHSIFVTCSTNFDNPLHCSQSVSASTAGGRFTRLSDLLHFELILPWTLAPRCEVRAARVFRVSGKRKHSVSRA